MHPQNEVEKLYLECENGNNSNIIDKNQTHIKRIQQPKYLDTIWVICLSP